MATTKAISKFGGVVRILVAGLIANFASIATVASPARATDNPIALYGPEIVFDVYRLGSKIGQHTVRFSAAGGGGVTASSQTKLVVTFMALPIYTFAYSATARWRNGMLQALDARADKNGTVTTVSARAKGQRMTINRSGGSDAVGLPVFPTNHWHSGVVGQRQVLNTLTGHMNTVTIFKTKTELVETEVGKVRAGRYQYAGELSNTVWYDAAGRWVKMTFAGTDGTQIEFVCRKCQGGLATSAVR